MLPDDDWSRGKCGLKVLQYLAAGLPVVGNPIGVTAELVGDSGMMVESNVHWIAALERLRDPNVRRRIGQSGRHRCEASFSVDVGIQGWRTFIRELVSRRQAG